MTERGEVTVMKLKLTERDGMTQEKTGEMVAIETNLDNSEGVLPDGTKFHAEGEIWVADENPFYIYTRE